MVFLQNVILKSCITCSVSPLKYTSLTFNIGQAYMCTVYPGLGRGQHVSVRHLRHHEEDGLVQAVLAGVLSGLRSAQSEGKVALVVGRHLHQHLNLLVGPVHARDNLIAVHVGRLVFAHRVGPVVPAEAAAAGVELPLGVEAAAVAPVVVVVGGVGVAVAPHRGPRGGDHQPGVPGYLAGLKRNIVSLQ